MGRLGYSGVLQCQGIVSAGRMAPVISCTRHKEIAVASASVGTLDSAPVAADYCYLINTTIVTMAK